MEKKLGGQAPYGYRWQKDTLIFDPIESPVRQYMYELYLLHRRVKVVVRVLNEQGYRTRKGMPFSPTTIKRLLKDPIAVGIWRRGHTLSSGKGKGWTEKPEKDWDIVMVKPLIETSTYQMVQDIMERKGGTSIQSKVSQYLFSGIVFCGCNNKMYVPSGRKKYTCVSCRRKIPAHDLEEIVRHYIGQFSFGTDDIVGYQEYIHLKLKRLENRIESINHQLDSIQKRVAILLDQTKYLVTEKEQSLHTKLTLAQFEQQEQLQKHKSELKGEYDFLILLTSTAPAELNLATRWNGFSLTEKRLVVETLIGKVIVGETINIEMKINPV